MNFFVWFWGHLFLKMGAIFVINGGIIFTNRGPFFFINVLTFTMKKCAMETTEVWKKECVIFFICNISLTIMNDPVLTPAGSSYERKNITTWLNHNNVDPQSRQPLEVKDLISNRALKEAINTWKKFNQTQVQSTAESL